MSLYHEAEPARVALELDTRVAAALLRIATYDAMTMIELAAQLENIEPGALLLRLQPVEIALCRDIAQLLRLSALAAPPSSSAPAPPSSASPDASTASTTAY